jgi:hypothetical protein
MSLLSVLPSCLAVVEQSRYVQINTTAIENLVADNAHLTISPLTLGPAPYHFCDSTGATAEWLFLLDTVNHCFWPDAGSSPWTVEYNNEVLSGYWALAASLKRAMEEGFSIHRATTLAELDSQTLAHIFRGRGKIPLLEERVRNLRQAGQVLLDRFQGSFIYLLEEVGGSATKLVDLLAKEFSSFNDTADYSNRKVYFYKRAQLLVHDLWCTFSGQSWGNFVDLENLTAFADYKLPQVLRHLSILQYKPQLADLIQNLVPIPAGSPEEVEIRAATVWAVELLRQKLTHHGFRVNSPHLDNWLWHLGQEDAYRALPYHRTRTIFY